MIEFTTNLRTNSAVILDCYHEWQFVLLSYILAVGSAYTSIKLIGRLISSQTVYTRILWTSLCGFSLGCGIWAMHFTGMLAFKAPIPVQYDLKLTSLSLVAAIACCSVAFAIYSLKQTKLFVAISSFFMGSGIGIMHYMGMAAMVIPAEIYYSPSLFILSLAIAYSASATALVVAKMFLTRRLKRARLLQVLSAFVMGFAIFGMHFTGMAGTELVLTELPTQSDFNVTPSDQLVGLVSMITVFILALSIFASLLHKKWEKNIKHIIQVESLLTEVEQNKQAMKELAYTDPVTELKNRRFLMEHLDQLIDTHQTTGKTFCLLFIDIDDFKNINDRYGHDYGDQLLQELAARLNQSVRNDDFVTRFGGDEFVVVLKTGDISTAKKTSDRILEVVTKEFLIQGTSMHVTTSLGMAQFPEHGDNVTELMKNADTALYDAKSKGKNQVIVFNGEMQQELYSKIAIENALRKAIESEAINVHYQPIICAKSKQIVQYEALARWHHNGNMVPPNQFIKIAEDRKIIKQLGDQLFKTICQDIAKLNRLIGTDMIYSFNVSPSQFKDKDLFTRINNQLNAFGINPKQIEIEITESSVFSDIELSIRQLNQLKELGISISIDDFGTGYSSLHLLKKLPIDKLKIDKSFVSSLPNDADDKAINQAILTMAKQLHLTVVAEGIETKEQAAFFIENGCQYLQGFNFSEAKAIESIIQHYKQANSNQNAFLATEKAFLFDA